MLILLKISILVDVDVDTNGIVWKVKKELMVNIFINIVEYQEVMGPGTALV